MSVIRAIADNTLFGLHRTPAAIYNAGISGIRNFRSSPPWRAGITPTNGRELES
jgi:hypothetical protein